MNVSGKQLIKILFSASLVVAISSWKGSFSEEFKVLGAFSYFFMFLLASFCLTLFELIVDVSIESDLYKRLFLKDTYICGWWLNYAYDKETNKINNFSIIHIGMYASKLYVDGMTFEVKKDGAGFEIKEASSYKSRIAQYHPRDRSLGFHFTVADSDDEGMMGRFGYCDYNFVKNDNSYPTSFQGQFSLDSLNKFCRVKGYKIEDKQVLASLRSSIPEDRYKVAIEHADEKKWFSDTELINIQQIIHK